MGPYAPSGAAEPSAAPEANTPADVLAVPGSAPGGRGGGLLWAGERMVCGILSRQKSVGTAARPVLSGGHVSMMGQEADERRRAASVTERQEDPDDSSPSFHNCSNWCSNQ